MELFSYFLLLLVIVWAGFLIFVQWAAHKTVGHSAESLELLYPEIREQPVSLVLFYSPRCEPCKQMQPLIAELKAETGQAFSMDITQEVATAQAMGIRATPTLMVIKDGLVDKLFLGTKNKAALSRLLIQDD